MGVKVQKSAIPNAGIGLFAAKVFEKGDIITFYDGITVSDDIAEVGSS